MRAVAEGADRFGRLDVVISNAGISGDVGALTEYPSDVFRRTLDVHVLGAFHILKHTVPRISDGGSIIITSSVVGLIGFPGLPAYVAAKHGQVGLMRAAAKELAPRRIRVNTMHPGPTSTAFQDDIEMRATGKSRRGGGEGLRRAVAARAPHDPRGDRARHALPGGGRERDGHVAHVLDRRWTERIGPRPSRSDRAGSRSLRRSGRGGQAGLPRLYSAMCAARSSCDISFKSTFGALKLNALHFVQGPNGGEAVGETLKPSPRCRPTAPA